MPHIKKKTVARFSIFDCGCRPEHHPDSECLTGNFYGECADQFDHWARVHGMDEIAKREYIAWVYGGDMKFIKELWAGNQYWYPWRR